MKILTLVQGSADWHAHRSNHFNASDAPAMLGISKYKTRAQLIKERATGIVPEVDDATQRRFNDGHRFEMLARVLAEGIIGDDLSPVTGIEGKYSASFDGITFDGSTIHEHKTLNDDIRKSIGANGNTGGLDEMYRAQMEHQLMVSGADKCLFMASKWDDDTLVEEVHGWYLPDHVLRARIVAGWEQFEKDVAAYQPAEEVAEVVAEAVIALPSLAVQIKGEVMTSNLPVFVSAADKFLAGIKTELVTDQDFANAEANVKACKTAEDGIEQTKKAITAQAVSIDEVMRTMDLYKEKLAAVRLKLDKLVKSEKDMRKTKMVAAANTAYANHVAGLQDEIAGIRLHLLIKTPDFGGAIKGLKSLASMHNALDTAVANGKIDADAVAKDVRAKLEWCKEEAVGMSFLFPDLQQIISMDLEAFKAVIKNRIVEHKAAEAAKAAALIAKIDAENAAKLEAERVRIQAEEEAKARTKVEAEAAEAKRKEEVAKHVTQHEQLVQNHIADAGKKVEKPATRPRASRAEILEVLSENFGLPEEMMLDWILAEFSRDIKFNNQAAA